MNRTTARKRSTTTAVKKDAAAAPSSASRKRPSEDELPAAKQVAEWQQELRRTLGGAHQDAMALCDRVDAVISLNGGVALCSIELSREETLAQVKQWFDKQTVLRTEITHKCHRKALKEREYYNDVHAELMDAINSAATLDELRACRTMMNCEDWNGSAFSIRIPYATDRNAAMTQNDVDDMLDYAFKGQFDVKCEPSEGITDSNTDYRMATVLVNKAQLMEATASGITSPTLLLGRTSAKP